MNKLEVGMYVRTKKGIAKIVEIFDKDNEPYDEAKYRTDTFLEIYYDSEYIGDEDIIGEPSNNIIDLIEVGDYVNGCYVEEVTKLYLGSGGYIRGVETSESQPYGWDKAIPEMRIKSIVTKEMYSSVEYRVEAD